MHSASASVIAKAEVFPLEQVYKRIDIIISNFIPLG